MAARRRQNLSDSSEELFCWRTLQHLHRNINREHSNAEVQRRPLVRIPEAGRGVVIKGTPFFYLEIAGEQRNIIRTVAKFPAREEAPDATVFSGCDLVHVPGDGNRRVHTADVHSKN